MPDVSYGQSLTGDEMREWERVSESINMYIHINVPEAQHAFECLINDSTFYHDD